MRAVPRPRWTAPHPPLVGGETALALAAWTFTLWLLWEPLLLALVPTVTAALTWVLYRAAARVWRRRVGDAGDSAPDGVGGAVESGGRVLVPRRRGAAVTSRAPPAVAPA
ncbi:MAG: hypothetical protein ACFCVG_02235 [Kineosporiaceae bacterium]